MPTMKDRETGQILAYPEAVLLTKPINPQFRGEVPTTFYYAPYHRHFSFRTCPPTHVELDINTDTLITYIFG